MYRIRKSSTSTKPSRNAVCATVGIPSSLMSNVANPGQHTLPEQVQRAHERVQIAGARRVQGQVEHAGAHHVATAPDLLDDRVRAPDERRGERAAHHGRPRFSGDVAESSVMMASRTPARMAKGAWFGCFRSKAWASSSVSATSMFA